MKEKLVSVLAKAGLTQTQRDPTRGQNLLDPFCCNKPSLVKTCISVPGISDHSIVLADCNLKTPITKTHKEGSTGGLKQTGLKLKHLLLRLLNPFWH